MNQLVTAPPRAGEGITTIPYHAAAAIFPGMHEDDMNALVEDVRRNGLLQPIWTYDGQIIDGRHRYEACLETGTEPQFREYGGDDVIAFVIGLNLMRRHLTESQKATIAVEALPLYEAAARQRQLAGVHLPQNFAEGREAAEAAAEAAGTNKQYVKDAKRMKDDLPFVYELMREGEMNIPAAREVEKISDTETQDTIVDELVAGTLTRHSTEIRQRVKELARQHRTEQREREVAHAESKPQVFLESYSTWLSRMPEADLLLTDPPYSTDVADVEAFAHEWLPLALARVKRTGRAYVCIGAYPSELAAYLSADRAHMELAQVLVWTYRNTLGPSPTHLYKLNWQAILYFVGPDAPPLDCPEMVEQFSVQDISAPDGRHDGRYHAWQKPDELARRFIHHSTKPGDVVLDPFCGTGSFILAAHTLGREAYGCDIDHQMIVLAQRRGCAYAS